MDSQLTILLISNNRDSAQKLSGEVNELFAGSHLSGCKPDLALQALQTRCFDLAILYLETADPNYYELVLNMGLVATDMPIIVSLPPGDTIPIRQFDSLKSVHCLIRDDEHQNSVTAVIEEVLRDSVDPTLDWIGSTNRATEGQAELIRATAGTLSHEINNPLMTILGISELILSDRSKYHPEVAQKITMIRRSAERIESSLKRLANVSQPLLRETPSGSLIEPEPSHRTRNSRKTRS